MSSAVSSRARSLLGLGGRSRRYVDLSEVADLEEIADNATLEDETQTTLREWAGENISLVIALSLITTVVGAVVIWQASRFIPSIVRNPYVQGVVAALILIGIGVKFGSSRKQAVIGGEQRLQLRFNNDSTTFLGQYIDAGSGNGGYFVPIKGFRTRGQRPTPYTVADLSAGMADLLSKPGMQPDHPAVILLHPSYTEVEETEHGTYISVRTDDLEPATESSVAVLKTTIPEFREEDVNKLAREAEKQAERASRNRKQADRWRSAYRDLMDQINAPVDERVQQRLEEHAGMAVAFRGGRPRRRQSDDDGVTAGGDDFRGADISAFSPAPMAAVDGDGATSPETIEDVEDELEDDDDD